MTTPLWECPNCDNTIRCDPVCGDEWDGAEIGLGPECEDCDEYMELVEEHPNTENQGATVAGGDDG